MTSSTFESFAQNGEDVVLWRALGGISNGCYVDIGAFDGTVHSVTKAFYDRGWSGINVEPLPRLAATITAQRPRDVTIAAAVTSADVDTVTMHELVDTGLSTLIDSIASTHVRDGFERRDLSVPALPLAGIIEQCGFQNREVHFLKIDVEGSEADVIRSVDLKIWRPWVLVVESTFPLSNAQTHDTWERLVLDAEYEFCLFDGLSRFYVASEHAPTLAPLLSYPACALDDYSTMATRELQHERQRFADELEQVRHDLIRWRTKAITAFAEGGRPATRAEMDRLRRENAAFKNTLSWRVTKPLRLLRTLLGSPEA